MILMVSAALRPDNTLERYCLRDSQTSSTSASRSALCDCSMTQIMAVRYSFAMWEYSK
jgi:hypothetical protein